MDHLTPWLCLAAFVVVALGYLLVWALCAAAADADDVDEQVHGIRRS